MTQVRAVVVVLAVGILGCARESGGPSSRPAEVGFESGPLAAASGAPGGEATDRAKPDIAAAEWVSGYAAEALPAGAAAEWHSDLRLTNGTRLLVATSRIPEVKFPDGFALPLAQILADVPEAWRGVELASGASDSSVERVRWRLDLIANPSHPQRLYALGLAITEPPGDPSVAAPPAWSSLSPLPGATWSVPPGPHVYSRQLSNVVAMDATVHAAVAGVGPHARSLRLTDTTDGRVLWAPVIADGPSGRIEPYRDEEGFAIYRDHVLELQVAYDNPGPEPTAGSGQVFLYYRVPGNGTVRYPLPPQD